MKIDSLSLYIFDTPSPSPQPHPNISHHRLFLSSLLFSFIFSFLWELFGGRRGDFERRGGSGGAGEATRRKDKGERGGSDLDEECRCESPGHENPPSPLIRRGNILGTKPAGPERAFQPLPFPPNLASRAMQVRECEAFSCPADRLTWV